MIESIQQTTQRRYTQLRNWFHGNDRALQRLLEDARSSNPDKDSMWCIEKVWSEQSAIRQ
ncbi:MAG: hypothetical protein VKJ24_10195 [Synechococcales bacterium]|nr:hypothetical protein [Synechococcales bacterium]